MKIPILNTFPGFYLMFFMRHFTSIMELYESLELSKKEVILNQLNIEKINSFFNNPVKNELISTQLLNSYNLENVATAEQIEILDYDINGLSISSLKTSHIIDVYNPLLCSFIESSKMDLFEKIKQSSKVIKIIKCDILDFKYIKNIDTFSLNFSIEAVVNNIQKDYFDHFNDFPIFYTCNTNENGEANILFNKNYSIQGVLV